MLPFDIPLLGRPILWYGFFFALGFFLAYCFLVYQLRRFEPYFSVPKKATAKFGERLTLYVTIGAVVGARLGDVLFYQDWEHLRQDPFSLLRSGKVVLPVMAERSVF